MCGRARCTLRPDDVPRASHRHGVRTRFLHLDRYRPSYNVAPGSYMPVLRTDNDGVAVHCMKWGLVPGFTKNTDKPDFFKMFNARSESVAEKPSFRRLLPKNRCLVAVDGFYEWKKEGSKKQPYYIHFKDGRPLVFAALFDSWQNSGGETLYTFTILTTSSSSAFQWLHDRMPVILGAKESVDTWLDDPSMSKLKPLLTPYENSDLVWYPVTSAIGKLSFDGPECIQQLPLKASKNSLISKFFLAKQPKTDEGDVFSVSNKKAEEVDEDKDKSNEAKNLGVKPELFIEDNSAVASHLETVKNEAEEDTSEEAKSIKTGLTKVTDEGNASIPSASENQLDQSNQLEAVEDKQGSENEKTVLDGQTMKEGGLEFSETSSGKSGTKKRDYELFSAQEKPWNQSERLQDVKSCGKHGKGKTNIKKSKDTQSTLHFFFDEK